MTVLAYGKRHTKSLVTLVTVWAVGAAASAQVATTHAYPTPPTAPAAYRAPAPTYAQHPMYAAPPTPPAYGQPVAAAPAPTHPTPPAYAAQPAYGQPVAPAAPATAPVYSQVAQPAYGQPVTPPAYGAPSHGQRTSASPRVAEANPTPAPAESIATPAPTTPLTVTPTPAEHQYQPGAATWEAYTGTAAPASYGGDCGDDCAPACNVGCYTPRCKRQWFGGLYYILLDRVDTDSTQIAYMTDTAGFTAGDPYYYQPTDACLHTDEADFDVSHGAEIRFGSTFGPCDPCTCSHRFAWEMAYWAIDDTDGEAWLMLDDAVSSTNTMRIYSVLDKEGLRYDIDGGGATYGDRPAEEYYDDGKPADGDVFANDVRVLAFRVRRRFSAQNLELNFWRFGSPECDACNSCSSGCGDSCYGGGGCGVATCQPARPVKRFLINGLVGVRYFRADDDLGIDTQFTMVDGAGDPTGSWGAGYTGFPEDEIGVLIDDIETDNQLVGFQLGCSMNWLIGCKWNLFADSNFGIYGNDAEVYQRTVLGGAGSATYTESGAAFTSVRYSDTNVAFLGELRTGVAYQLTCNCRLSAAYRFLGAGGLALSDGQIADNYANEGVITHVNADDSLILHGLQLGAEYKY